MRVRQTSLLLILMGLSLPAGSCIGGWDGGDPGSDPAAKQGDGPVLREERHLAEECAGQLWEATEAVSEDAQGR